MERSSSITHERHAVAAEAADDAETLVVAAEHHRTDLASAHGRRSRGRRGSRCRALVVARINLVGDRVDDRLFEARHSLNKRARGQESSARASAAERAGARR